MTQGGGEGGGGNGDFWMPSRLLFFKFSSILNTAKLYAKSMN